MTEQNQTEQFLHLIKFKDQLITILSNSRTFAIGYHPDADGFASAAILIKYLLSNGVARKNIDLYPANTNERVLEPAQADEVAEKQPDLLIYLDMCGHDPEQIRALKKKVGRIASIDHHRFDSKWPPLFDLYINCKFFAELAHPEEHTTSKLMNTLFHEPQNNWLEIAGLEGDNVVPSLPLTLSHRASSILNQLGEIESGDEDPEIRSGRRNALLDCILLSENLPDFVRRFEEAKKLYELYLKIEADIKDNVENLKKLEPALEFHSSKIFTYEIMAREGYALMNQILKGHLPFLG
ncbi:MAG: hypothetical protein HYU98_02515, partial [Deltaproteobacteria bacterium]|nr:hypothetical protein [Deltaproteobacteria bacterium]